MTPGVRLACQTRDSRDVQFLGLPAGHLTTAEFTVKKDGVEGILETLAEADIVVSDDGLDLIVDVALVPADTVDLTTGDYGFRFFATVDGEIRKRATGRFVVCGSVST